MTGQLVLRDNPVEPPRSSLSLVEDHLGVLRAATEVLHSVKDNLPSDLPKTLIRNRTGRLKWLSGPDLHEVELFVQTDEGPASGMWMTVGPNNLRFDESAFLLQSSDIDGIDLALEAPAILARWIRLAERSLDPSTTFVSTDMEEIADRYMEMISMFTQDIELFQHYGECLAINLSAATPPSISLKVREGCYLPVFIPEFVAMIVEGFNPSVTIDVYSSSEERLPGTALLLNTEIGFGSCYFDEFEMPHSHKSSLSVVDHLRLLKRLGDHPTIFLPEYVAAVRAYVRSDTYWNEMGGDASLML